MRTAYFCGRLKHFLWEFCIVPQKFPAYVCPKYDALRNVFELITCTSEGCPMHIYSSSEMFKYPTCYRNLRSHGREKHTSRNAVRNVSTTTESIPTSRHFTQGSAGHRESILGTDISIIVQIIAWSVLVTLLACVTLLIKQKGKYRHNISPGHDKNVEFNFLRLANFKQGLKKLWISEGKFSN